MTYRIFLFLCLVSACFAKNRLEVLHEMSLAPGNITVSSEQRVFLSLQAFYTPPFQVVEVLEDGQVVPYPECSWNRPEAGRLQLTKVFGLQCDHEGVLWILDGASPTHPPRIIAWNTRLERLEKIISLPPPITRKDSFINDLAIDSPRDRIYITDTARGNHSALIVVNTQSGGAWRVLEGHPSVTPKNLDLIIDGKGLRKILPDGKMITPRLGANPIALDSRNQWLYFGPMHSHSLYRIPAEELSNQRTSLLKLMTRVVRYGTKPICDGISIDNSDNIYFSDLAQNAIGILNSRRKYRQFLQHPRYLSWTNAFSFGPDGYLYAVSSQIHKSPVLNAGKNLSLPPFYLIRVRALDRGVTGR